MGVLDNVISKIQGDQNIDDHEVRQALKQAFKNLAKTDDGARYFDHEEAIPKAYFNEKMLPELIQLDTTSRAALLAVLKERKNDLAGLVENVHTTMDYTSRKGVAPQKIMNTLPGVVGPKLKETGDFLTSISGIQDKNEQEQTLLFEVLNRAKKVQAKFDDYVYRGDGKKYGSGGGSIQNFLSGDDIVEFHGSVGKNQAYSEVEDTDKDTVEDILLMIVTKAKDPKDTSVDFSSFYGGKSVNLGSKLNQLAEIASYFDALERGIDDANQGIIASIATAPAELGALVISESIPTNLTNATYGVISLIVLKYAHKKGWLQAGWNKVSGKIGSATDTKPTSSEGTPESSKKGPKKYGPILANGKLDDFAPKSENHKEYIKNTIATIEGNTTLSASEKVRRIQAFTEVSNKFSEGKISVQEFTYKTSQIEKGIVGSLVKDNDGKIQKGATIKKAATKVADTITGGRVDSKQSAYEAMKVATGRIQGSQYTTSSIDASAKDIDFSSKDARELYEKWRDGLKRYVQLQEWGNYHKSTIQPQEKLLADLQSDYAAKKIEVTRLATLIQSTDSTISQTQVVNGASVSSNVPNPAYGEATEMLRGEMAAQKQLEQTINTQRAKIAEVTAGAPMEGRPKSANRTLWQVEIQAQKTVLEGILNDIDTHNTGHGASKVPRTQMNFDARKIDPISWAKVVEKAIKH